MIVPAIRSFAVVATFLVAIVPVFAHPPTPTMDKPIPLLASFRNEMPEIGAKEINLGEITQAKQPILFIFMANRCGVTWLYADKIADLVKRYRPTGKLTILGVHSNSEESDKELIDELKKRGITLPVLDDKPNQILADTFAAQVTPYFVVVDGNGILRYRGPFDKMGGSLPDSKRPQYLRPALDAVLSGKPVALKTVRALGCEITRRKKPMP